MSRLRRGLRQITLAQWIVIGVLVVAMTIDSVYLFAQSFEGRVDAVKGSFNECMFDRDERNVIARDPSYSPDVRRAAALVTRPTEEGRRELCRSFHPKPDASPFGQ